MISLNAIAAPPAADSLKPFFDLLGLLADPAAAKERLETFAAASEELRVLIAQAKAAEVDRAAAETAHRQMLEKTSGEAAAHAAQARANFAADCQRREVALTARDARLAAMENRVKADADANEALKSELSRRLALITAAAATAA